MLNSARKEEVEETNENHVLEEPGNEIAMNSDHLNQIVIPPSFEKQDNGIVNNPFVFFLIRIGLFVVTKHRQQAIVNSFKHAWKGYKCFAWGHDHLKPISGGHHDWFGLGLTIVDSLDTIYLMGLKEGEFNSLVVH